MSTTTLGEFVAGWLALLDTDPMAAWDQTDEGARQQMLGRHALADDEQAARALLDNVRRQLPTDLDLLHAREDTVLIGVDLEALVLRNLLDGSEWMAAGVISERGWQLVLLAPRSAG